ncbi:hypothetical protein PIB30_025898 [Stylosanthes scabra]|uniref:Secreted protein n=1 Tax=Stylosanthes scabra TaxID=79078 RepID=A0ABU6YAS5_9FABA|nr:hypothetical protein [Stylosanthes scabra]
MVGEVVVMLVVPTNFIFGISSRLCNRVSLQLVSPSRLNSAIVASLRLILEIPGFPPSSASDLSARPSVLRRPK